MSQNLQGVKKPTTIEELIRRPELCFQKMATFFPEAMLTFKNYDRESLYTAEVAIKYSGYINKAVQQAKNYQYMVAQRFPENLFFDSINGLSREVLEKLKKHQPKNLDEASRISGVTPAALSVIAVHLKKINNIKQNRV